ncbi:hypothetical protein P9112_014408 [Eukaryota sp. TZLM1-RC]
MDSDRDYSDLSDFSDDEELSVIRERRMAEMKNQHRRIQNMLSSGHGSLREIDEGQFLKEVTSSTRVVVHFYHPEFKRCEILDYHLDVLAQQHIEAKFIKIEASKAPFFVTKLNIKVLPCTVFFFDGVAKDRMVGFERLGNNDDFSTPQLERVLINAGVIDDFATRPE